MGNLFCEEFYPSLFSRLFRDKSQFNLSKMLTRDGNILCQFAVYIRKANLDEKQFKNFFTVGESNASFNKLFKDPKEKYEILCLKMYYYFLEVSWEKYSDEGKAVIASAIQNLADFAVNFIKKRAEMTKNIFNDDYFNKNFAIDKEY